MGAYDTMTTKLLGLIADNRKVREVMTVAPQENFNFGDAVFGYRGDNITGTGIQKGYRMYMDTDKLVFDADFQASNSIVITVNGVAADAVTFTSDHDTTAGLVAAAITALDGVDCYLDASDANLRTFWIRTKGATCVVTEAVTGGSGQPTGTVSSYSDQVFLGVVAFSQKETNSDGYAYTATDDDAMSVLTRGGIYVKTSSVVVGLSKAYVGSTDLFSNTSTDFETNAMIMESGASAGTVLLEVNGAYKPNAEITWA